MTPPQRRNERFIECVLSEVFVFIKQAFPFPRLVNRATAVLNGERSCREKRPLPGSDLGFCKSCQKSRQLGKNKNHARATRSADIGDTVVFWQRRFT